MSDPVKGKVMRSFGAANPQAQIVRYRIEVTLKKEEGRWLLSGIKGTEGPGND